MMLNGEYERNSKSLIDILESHRDNGYTDKELKKVFERYFEDKAYNKAIPLNGVFELTPYCNLDCAMCYIHLSANQYENSKLLNVGTWKKLMLEAHQAGMLNATLTGGECLTYPHFCELYLYLHQIGVIPTVLTNGTLLTDNVLALLSGYPPSLVQVTLYGSNNNAYELVTGKRVFDNVIESIYKLREASIRTLITITPNAYMRNDIPNLLKLVHNMGIPYRINAALIAPRENTQRQFSDLDIEDYIEIYKLQSELEGRALEKISECSLPKESQLDSSDDIALGLTCRGGRSSFVIRYDGSMSTCPSLNISAYPLRNGFANAWREVVNLASSYRVPIECRDCVYRDYCITCPAIHERRGLSGHRDPSICRRMKRLVSEGLVVMNN